MAAVIIPFPLPKVIRRTEDRLRVLLDGVNDYWSLRDFTRDFVAHQLDIEVGERARISKEMHQLWQVYPPATRSTYCVPRHAV